MTRRYGDKTDDFQSLCLATIREAGGELDMETGQRSKLPAPQKSRWESKFTRSPDYKYLGRCRMVTWYFFAGDPYSYVSEDPLTEAKAKESRNRVAAVADLLGLRYERNSDTFYSIAPASLGRREGRYLTISVDLLSYSERLLLPSHQATQDVECLFSVCEETLAKALKSSEPSKVMEADGDCFLILADALEEVGCDREQLMSALRAKQGKALFMVPIAKKALSTEERAACVARVRLGLGRNEFGSRLGTNNAAIGAALTEEPQSPKEIAALCPGVQVIQCKNYCNQLVAKGLILRTAGGRFHLRSTNG